MKALISVPLWTVLLLLLYSISMESQLESFVNRVLTLAFAE